jgi:cytoskeletal protein CcmA (bactofilin family)
MSDKNGLPTGKHTLVEEGTEFKGTLSSKCPIVVMGKVEGDVTGPIIHVTASGVVAGNVKVQELRSDGELAGEVEADTVRISGRVRDKTVIRARALEVSLSTGKGGMEVTFGECELSVGDEPNKEAAVAAALAAPTPPATVAKEPEKQGGKKRDKPTETTSPGWSEAAAPAEPEEDGKRRTSKTLPPPIA